MKFKYFLFFILVAFFIGSCERTDILLSGYDEIHSIKIYGNEFELMHNGFNTAKGTYKFSKDTIFLTYNTDEIINGKNANQLLTKKLLIDTSGIMIKSIDQFSFCALIRINKFKKS